MPLKSPPFVGLEDALKGAVVDGTTQGQHMVGLLTIPPGSGALQPHMTDAFVRRLDAPTPDGITALPGCAVVQPLSMVAQKADQLADFLGGLGISGRQGLQPRDPQSTYPQNRRASVASTHACACTASSMNCRAPTWCTCSRQ
jgi:hypothetical protein